MLVVMQKTSNVQSSDGLMDGISEQDSKVTPFWAYTNMARGLVIRLASTGAPAYQQAMHVRMMCMEYGITWNKQHGRQAMRIALMLKKLVWGRQYKSIGDTR
jgi:hypothetical protein